MGREKLPRGAEYISLTRAAESYINDVRRAVPKYRGFSLKTAEDWWRYRKPETLSPPWFLPEEEGSCRQMIIDELGWKPASVSWPRGGMIP